MNDLRMNHGASLNKWLLVAWFVSLWLPSANHVVAGEIISGDFPALEDGTYFSAQGKSIAIVGDYLNRESDPHSLVAVNMVSGKTVKLDSMLWAAPVVFFDEGTKFLTATAGPSEGPTTFSVYDFDGDVSASLTTKASIRPSPTGEYFYTVNNLVEPFQPVVYASDFTKVKEFLVGHDVSGSCDAVITGDSLYVLRDRNSLRLYRLPSFDLLTEYGVELGPGAPVLKLFCNESCTLCGISNYYSLGLINTVTGYTQTLSFDFIDKVHISDNGNRLYMVRGRSGHLDVHQYVFDGDRYSLTISDNIPLADYHSGQLKARPDAVIETSEGLAVNLTFYHGKSSQTGWKSVSTLLWSLPSKRSQSLPVEFMEGVTWLDRSSPAPTLRRLTPLTDGKATVDKVIFPRMEVRDK